MPRTLTVNGHNKPVATEKELLEFVNKGRAAGAAEILEELLPSQKSIPEQCLIANALNFGCCVDGLGFGKDSEYYERWGMFLPDDFDNARAEALAAALDCPLIRDPDYDGIYAIVLPEHIGNAAEAFDAGCAFQEYAH